MITLEELSRRLARINAAGMGIDGRGDGPFWRSHTLDLVEAHIRHAKQHPVGLRSQAPRSA